MVGHELCSIAELDDIVWVVSDEPVAVCAVDEIGVMICEPKYIQSNKDRNAARPNKLPAHSNVLSSGISSSS